MSENVGNAVGEDCVKVCSNEDCNMAEFQPGRDYCWKCSGTNFIVHCIAPLNCGAELVLDASEVRENPAPRPGAASSGFDLLN